MIPAGGGAGAGTVPSLAAAQAMSTRTVPTVHAAVGERFDQVAELCEQAGKRFLIADSQLTMAWNKMPTLLRPPS